MNININRGDWIVKNSNKAYENAWIVDFPKNRTGN